MLVGNIIGQLKAPDFGSDMWRAKNGDTKFCEKGGALLGAAEICNMLCLNSCFVYFLIVKVKVL